MVKPILGIMLLALGTQSGCSMSPVRSIPAMSWEESMVFQPERHQEGIGHAKDPSFADAWFHTPDGIRLHGWFASVPQPRAVVLYMHGNAGNIDSRQDVVRLFRDRLRTSILIFDYRGYGRSEGSPSEAGILADARAARRWLAERTGVAEKDIVLVGNSLGGSVAVDLAAKDGARGLVLENTFSSLPEVAAYHFPLLPVSWIMKTRLNSAAKIAAYHGPLLQTHGDADRVVPFASGQKLFAAANEPKEFVKRPGGDHNDPLTAEYWMRLDQFLDSLSTIASSTKQP